MNAAYLLLLGAFTVFWCLVFFLAAVSSVMNSETRWTWTIAGTAIGPFAWYFLRRSLLWLMLVPDDFLFEIGFRPLFSLGPIVGVAIGVIVASAVWNRDTDRRRFRTVLVILTVLLTLTVLTFVFEFDEAFDFS